MSNSSIFSLTANDLLKLIPDDQDLAVKDLLVAVQILANDVPLAVLGAALVHEFHYANGGPARAAFADEVLDFLVTGVFESRAVWDPAFFLEDRGIVAQPAGWSSAPVVTRLAFALLLLPPVQQTRVAAEQLVALIDALPLVSGHDVLL